jgi:ferrochelatase
MHEATAVLLLAYGGPKTMDDIEPFLQRLLGRPELPPQLVARVREKYARIGGGSPLPGVCAQIRHRLTKALAAGGRTVPVYLGFRYSEPSIPAVVAEMAAAGRRRILALSLSPHAATISTRAYYDRLEPAAAEHGMTVIPIDHWYREPAYIDCLETRIRRAAAKHGIDLAAAGTALVFSAHNIPQSYLDRGDPYVDEIRENIALLTARFPGLRHALGYQSKGKAPGPWLTPEIEDLIAALRQDGARNLVLIPISFAMDHLETIFDLDIELLPPLRAAGGMHVCRTPMANADDDFIAVLHRLIIRTA